MDRSLAKPDFIALIRVRAFSTVFAAFLLAGSWATAQEVLPTPHLQHEIPTIKLPKAIRIGTGGTAGEPTAVTRLPTVDIDGEGERWWDRASAAPLLKTNIGPVANVSLDQLVFAALSNSNRITVAKIDGFVEREKVTQQDANFDWNLFTQTLFTTTNQATGSGLEAGVGQNRLVQNQYSTNFGARRTNRLGGNFEAKQNLQLLDSNSLFVDPNEQGLSQLVLRYNQPLLRDGGLLVNEGQVLVAQLNANATFADSQAAIANILVEVVQAYWELHRLRSRYVVQRRLVGHIKKLREGLLQRSNIDAKQSLIGQADSELATQQATLAATRTQLIQAQQKLIRLVGDRQLVGSGEIIPISQAPSFQFEFEPQSAFSLAMQSRPEIRAAFERIRGSELNSAITTRNLLPSLAFILETTVTGVNGNFDLLNSIGDQFSEGAPSFAVGFNLDLPVQNRAARSRAREAELLLAREVASFEDTVDQIRLEVAESVTGLRGASNQYLIRKESIDKAHSVVEALLKRRKIFPEQFDQVSQLYVREILDAQQRKAAAEIAAIDLLFDFAVTTIQLRRATGVLLSQFGPAGDLNCPTSPGSVLPPTQVTATISAPHGHAFPCPPAFPGGP